MQNELFGSTKKKQDSNSFQTFSSDSTDYTLVQSKKALDELCSYLKHEDVFAFDTETDSVDPLSTNLVGISIAVAEGIAWYIPTNSMGLTTSKIIEALRPYFEDSDKTHVAHNYKFDYKVLYQQGLEIKGDIFDTMIAGYLLDHDQTNKMDTLSKKYLSYQPISIDGMLAGDKTMFDIPIPEVHIYASEDADVTYRLYTVLRRKLQEMGMSTLAYDIEFPLTRILAGMEMEGVKLNDDFLEGYNKELQKELDEAKRKMFDIAGGSFNPNSYQQVGNIMFDKLGLPVIETTDSGNRSTGVDTLEKLKDHHEFPALMLEHREIAKLKGTYVEPMPRQIREDTGRLHTDFMQHITATGRLSSRDPNLQNIPIRTERGRKVRKAFVAREGFYLLNADYSQMELRIIASICQDENMLEIFRNGEDIHSGTAAEIYDVPIDEVSGDQRYNAKTINYALPYGAGEAKVARELGIKNHKAAWLLNNYFQKFPRMKEYIDGQHEFVKEHGYVETRFGRRRWLPNIDSSNQWKRFSAQREAVNMPIQGESADIMKKAMINVNQYIQNSDKEIYMLLQVHDELVFEIPKENAYIVEKAIVKRMEGAADIGVPLDVDSGVSKTWFEGH